MSSEVSSHVDFVFELQESAKVNDQVKYRNFCSNEDCENHTKDYMNSGFCPKCGSTVKEEKEITGKSFPSKYDFCEKYLNDEDFCAGDNGDGNYLPDNVWLYNRAFPPEIYNGVINIGSAHDLTDFNVKDAIVKVENIPEIKMFLNKFKEIYGEDSIKIKFMFYSTLY